MAVPKRKTSPSKRGTRRAHNALKALNIVIDPKTGKHHLPHMMSDDGLYRGRSILKKS
ncbi:50S ribosomal protein L32 [Candidatus Fokinia solitaria]|nr:50S ribosomal protein L32 [Candidatus Fokinia solitaria]